MASRLAKLNPHPRDNKITFMEEGHQYTIDGMTEHPISVTTLIHEFFPKFDADTVIDKMMKSTNWPQSKYYGKTKDEIKEQWETDRDNSAKLGTEMHRSLELFMNEEPQDQVAWLQHFVTTKTVPANLPQTKEFTLFMHFWRDLQEYNSNFKPYRTEWIVYDEAKRLAGSIDMTLANDQGQILILDWKRSKELKKENRYQSGLKCLKHLADCNYSHYSIQLNCYRRLLQTLYGKTVIGMYLVILHPNNDNYMFVPVPVMEKEVGEMFAHLPMTVKHETPKNKYDE